MQTTPQYSAHKVFVNRRLSPNAAAFGLQLQDYVVNYFEPLQKGKLDENTA
jgi:hypothetical protein